MQDPEIDRFFKEHFGDESMSIADDGFSSQVIAALPRRRPSWPWLRVLIISTMTVFGCWLGLIVLPGGDFLREWLSAWPRAQFIAAIPISWLILVYLSSWFAVSSLIEPEAGRDR